MIPPLPGHPHVTIRKNQVSFWLHPDEESMTVSDKTRKPCPVKNMLMLCCRVPSVAEDLHGVTRVLAGFHAPLMGGSHKRGVNYCLIVDNVSQKRP